MRQFRPHPRLRNGHLMTVVSAFWPRSFPRLPAATHRLFEVEQGTQVRGECNWQEDRRAHSTLVLLHGLEGSSDSGYMRGCAEKAFAAGFNVVRMNQRNCGGTEHLTPTLYHSGRSADLRAVLAELVERDGLGEIFLVGWSMGGNLVLKMAGEFGSKAPEELHGIAAVNPCFDLAACVDALGEARNFVYSRHFVRKLKRRMRRKAQLFGGIYSLDQLSRVHTVRNFDGMITARYCGFHDADDYYAQSSAMHVLGAIQVPTLILTAHDDPFVPFSTFSHEAMRNNSFIRLVAPEHGGHCGFISDEHGEERFWSEARVVEFCAEQRELGVRELGGRTGRESSAGGETSEKRRLEAGATMGGA
ncbi:MAG TPA: alpha/beta fold hydrolase [Candidatus Acidoferrales bacterium]|nr:alpha/beta fold hydrolase [Candidatus Acidoferrales bacterium]